MNPSLAFNQFYGHFMTELGLAFPDDQGVTEVQNRFRDAVEADVGGPARALPKQVEPLMEALMAHDAKTASEDDTNALLRRVCSSVQLLHGLDLPATDTGSHAKSLQDNKNAVVDYVRNLGLMAIGLANMPPGVLEMITTLAGDCGGGDDDCDGASGGAGDVMASLAPMLGGLLGPGFNFGL